ncbi:stress response translation initiation inhibitor YciH [Halomarina salina]|uniref:Stress response translation initiation inhibitor YciH n=1 Tax=Halomarina salina TaxID=1872699 RepID=A0ABD5RLA0_9EURY
MPKDFSDVTGLPDDLGIGDDLARAEQHLTVRVESRRYGKPMTIVGGFDDGTVDLKDLASTLKRRLATGGTVEKDSRTIELQGDHADRLPDVLRDEGFQVA